MPKQVLNVDAQQTVEVPADVAKCPYCDAAMKAELTGFTMDASGAWVVDEIMTECASEPPMDAPEWDDHFNSHGDMPYVHQLPAEIKVMEWLNATYCFEMTG